VTHSVLCTRFRGRATQWRTPPVVGRSPLLGSTRSVLCLHLLLAVGEVVAVVQKDKWQVLLVSLVICWTWSRLRIPFNIMLYVIIRRVLIRVNQSPLPFPVVVVVVGALAKGFAITLHSRPRCCCLLFELNHSCELAEGGHRAHFSFFESHTLSEFSF